MAMEGTVVNGVIVLEGGLRLPEGSHVWVELEDPHDPCPPPEPYDREKDLANLRESIADMKAGRTTDARQALADIARKYGLPLEPGE